MVEKSIEVQIAYALPMRALALSLRVPIGTTASQLLEHSAIRKVFEQIPAKPSLGVWGQELRNPDHYELQAGDRVEIYRCLTMNPMTARRQRANLNAP